MKMKITDSDDTDDDNDDDLSTLSYNVITPKLIIFIFIIRAFALQRTSDHQDHTNYATQRLSVKVH